MTSTVAKSSQVRAGSASRGAPAPSADAAGAGSAVASTTPTSAVDRGGDDDRQPEHDRADEDPERDVLILLDLFADGERRHHLDDLERDREHHDAERGEHQG